VSCWESRRQRNPSKRPSLLRVRDREESVDNAGLPSAWCCCLPPHHAASISASTLPERKANC